MSKTPNTAVVATNTEKSVAATFFPTLLFGPLGLLYASIGGGIFLTIAALIGGAMTLGMAAFLVWPIAIVWGVLAAMASKPSAPATR